MTITTHWRNDYWLLGIVYDSWFAPEAFDVRIGLGPFAINIEWRGNAFQNMERDLTNREKEQG